MPHLRTLLLLGFLTICSLSRAQLENYPVGARASGMGNATVALTDVWAAHYNQAGLGRLEKFSAGVFYENQYNIKELGLKAAALGLPSKFGNFGLSLTQFGYKLYQENKIGIAYAKSLGKHIWAGIQLDYFHLRFQKEYGQQGTYTFEAGLQAQILPKLLIGFHIFNPVQAEIKTRDYKESIPTIARLGLAWHPSEEVILTLETTKDLERQAKIKAGVEYRAIKHLFLRAGAGNHPETISMGLGYQLNPLSADIAFIRHPVLGYSPSVSLSLQL